jgi:hypothetical protein
MNCECGRAMVGNGTRIQKITDWSGGGFVSSAAEVRRFRCRDCGGTSSLVSPEMEPGFRLSRAAADKVVDAALDRGSVVGSAGGPVDDATVSRLLSARVTSMLRRIERPRISRLELVPGAGVVVSDALTHETVTTFSSFDDGRIMPWLSTPHPAVLVPDAGLAPKLLKHTVDFVIAMPIRVVAEALRPLVARARARLESFAGRGGDATPSAAGNARHFERMCSTLYGALDSPDVVSGRKVMERWASSCEGAWADVFAPVLRFLEAFSSTLFSHPMCLAPQPPTNRLSLSGPANVLALRIDRERRAGWQRPEGPRLGMALR